MVGNYREAHALPTWAGFQGESGDTLLGSRLFTGVPSPPSLVCLMNISEKHLPLLGLICHQIVLNSSQRDVIKDTYEYLGH